MPIFKIDGNQQGIFSFDRGIKYPYNMKFYVYACRFDGFLLVQNL